MGLLVVGFIAIVVLAVIGQSGSERTSRSSNSPVNISMQRPASKRLEPKTNPVPEVPTLSSNLAPVSPLEPLMKMTSTDGRIIEAEVLKFSDSSITVKRKDGQIFDIPVSRFNDQTKSELQQREKLQKIAPQVVPQIGSPPSNNTGMP